MKIAALDDYHETLPTLDCFAKLSRHDVEVWTDHIYDVLAEALQRPPARERKR